MFVGTALRLVEETKSSRNSSPGPRPVGVRPQSVGTSVCACAMPPMPSMGAASSAASASSSPAAARAARVAT